MRLLLCRGWLRGTLPARRRIRAGHRPAGASSHPIGRRSASNARRKAARGPGGRSRSPSRQKRAVWGRVACVGSPIGLSALAVSSVMTPFDAPKARRLCAEEADSRPQMPEATAPPGPRGPESAAGPDGPSPKHRKRARIPCTNLSTGPRPTRSGPPGSEIGLTPLFGTRNLFVTRWPESPIGRRTAAKGNPSARASPRNSTSGAKRTERPHQRDPPPREIGGRTRKAFRRRQG